MAKAIRYHVERHEKAPAFSSQGRCRLNRLANTRSNFKRALMRGVERDLPPRDPAETFRRRFVDEYACDPIDDRLKHRRRPAR
jgi:hypothetical protein